MNEWPRRARSALFTGVRNHNGGPGMLKLFASADHHSLLGSVRPRFVVADAQIIERRPPFDEIDGTAEEPLSGQSHRFANTLRVIVR